MAPVVLSKGAVERIYLGESSFRPTLQIISIRRQTANSHGPSRFHVTLSDGVHAIVSHSVAVQTIQALFCLPYFPSA